MIFAGFFARIAASAVFGKAKKILGKVPSKVWIALGVVILLALAVVVHQRYARAQIDAAYEEGVKAERNLWEGDIAEMQKEVLAWKQKYETKSNDLSELERKNHELALRANAAAATDLRMRGPGAAAACSGSGRVAGLSTSASLNGSPPADANAGGAGVLPENWAAMPWNWLVGRAEQCDADRDEVIRWRNWYPAQRSLYEESKRRLSAEVNNSDKSR